LTWQLLLVLLFLQSPLVCPHLTQLMLPELQAAVKTLK
jgi:hypothetical protein